MVKSVVKRVLPEWALDALRSLRKRRRRKRWEKSVESDEEAHIDRSTLAEQLAALGVERGRDLILHSALSAIGYVDGGPDALIGALLDVLGPDANLLMPAYPMKSSMLETMEDPAPFDVANDRSYMGKITEVFRHMPGVRRSGHPTHSVAVLGPDAETYVAQHHMSGSPCGAGSPFRMLSERNGQILCIGVGVGKVTSHHTIEDLVESFPLDVYLPKKMTKLVRLAKGESVEVEVLVHDPKLAPIRCDSHDGICSELLSEMRERGIVREGKIGRATSQLFGAAELDAMHADRLKRGRTIYATR
jgi:aminoglycoside 3-N-acetyltransferase